MHPRLRLSRLSGGIGIVENPDCVLVQLGWMFLYFRA